MTAQSPAAGARRLSGRVVAATHNSGKLRELRELLAPHGIEAVGAAELNLAEPEETGATFRDNAAIKAEAAARASGEPALADDSGLEVDALAGAPGVWSSSFGGEEGNHARNNARLLAEMEGKTDRQARFRCTMVLARDGREEAHFSGTVEGRIIDSLRGKEGFGYDPLFVPDGFKQTFAELGAEVKNTLSHRFRALAQVVNYLENWSSN